MTNPVNDAQDMASVLQTLQFQVLLKTDATLEAMADAVFQFGERLKGGGVGLFYYAGHGLQVKGENYLIPIDANLVREDDIKRKTINARDVLDKMDEAKSHLNLVFLDACRNNPFPRKSARRTGRNGAYTKHLLHYITQPGLEVGMMLRRVRAAVKEETKDHQVPWENGSIEGEFYFSGTSGGPPATVTAPPTVSSLPPQPPGTRPSSPTPVVSGAPGGAIIDISGVWRGIYPTPGTITQFTREGNTFRFAVRGAVGESPFNPRGMERFAGDTSRAPICPPFHPWGAVQGRCLRTARSLPPRVRTRSMGSLKRLGFASSRARNEVNRPAKSSGATAT